MLILTYILRLLFVYNYIRNKLCSKYQNTMYSHEIQT